MQVSFVGLPGSGKTSVGRLVARRLHRTFLDSDFEVERLLGCSIRAFFDREGEEQFRNVEERVIDQLAGLSESVLSTGGGVVMRAVNREHLRQRSKVVYLRSTPEELIRRLRHDTKRPMLQVDNPLARLSELFALRDPLYREVAHFVIETGRPSISTLVNIVVTQLELGGAISER